MSAASTFCAASAIVSALMMGKPLSASRAASLKGKLKVFVGNHQVNGDPRKIVLKPHEIITIEQGRTVTPPPFQFPPGL